MSTLRNGNPMAATRGATHKRAKAALGDALDKRLGIIEAAEFGLLASVIGVGVESVQARLDAATLGELQEWTEAVEGKTNDLFAGCGTGVA